MSESLGSLYVDLKANTADFISGMSKASYLAKQAGRDIESSFSRLGGIASAALAPLGNVGASIGQVLSQVGAYAGAATKSIGGMSGGVSGLAVAGGAAVGAIAAVGVGAVALAMRTADSIAKLYEQAQMAGVSTEALSRLSFAAEHVGVSQDSLVTALERMSKSALASTTAARSAANPYKALGIAVTDASGAMKPADALFAEIAGKLSAMTDETKRTALEMAIFGRGGAQLAPLLALGTQGIVDLTNESDRLGKTISTQTGKAAENFEQNLRTLKGEAEGLANALTARLLPAMIHITAAFAGNDLQPHVAAPKSLAEMDRRLPQTAGGLPSRSFAAPSSPFTMVQPKPPVDPKLAAALDEAIGKYKEIIAAAGAAGASEEDFRLRTLGATDAERGRTSTITLTL